MSSPSFDRTSNFIALGELPDVVGCAERQRLNGHRRLASAGSDEARTVAQEQIRHVVGSVILVDDGARARRARTAPRRISPATAAWDRVWCAADRTGSRTQGPIPRLPIPPSLNRVQVPPVKSATP